MTLPVEVLARWAAGPARRRLLFQADRRDQAEPKTWRDDDWDHAVEADAVARANRTAFLVEHVLDGA